MKKFFSLVGLLFTLALLTACGGSDAQDLDFRSMRDIELGVTVSLGQTIDEISEVLEFLEEHSADIIGGHGIAVFENGMYIRFEDGVAIHIQGNSYPSNERFEILGHTVGGERDWDWHGFLFRSYNEQGDRLQNTSMSNNDAFINSSVSFEHRFEQVRVVVTTLETPLPIIINH